MSIKMKLRVKMAEINISQKELAIETGIRPNTLGSYMNETYKHITKEHLDILCKFFKCTIEDLIEYVQD